MKNQAKKQFKVNNETGNVLVIVLITIALLASLTFAFIKGDSGSNTNTLSKGEAKIAASDILKYAKSVENTVRRLQTINQCSESEISFELSYDPTGHWSNYDHTPTKTECQIFHVEGGGLSYQEVDLNFLAEGVGWQPNYGHWALNGNIRVTDVGSNASGTPCQGCDLVIGIKSVSDILCQSLNNHLGYGLTSIPIHNNNISFHSDVNNFSGINDYVHWDSIPAELHGKKSGCFWENGGNNVFYHVLIAR